MKSGPPWPDFWATENWATTIGRWIIGRLCKNGRSGEGPGNWAKARKIGRRCLKWKIGRKNKILENLKQSEFE